MRFTGVLVKINSYSKQLEGNLTRSSQIIQIDKTFNSTHTVTPVDSSRQRGSDDRKTIEDINQDGYFTFKGTVIKELSRITTYQACSNCNKKIDNCKCPTPGKQVNRMILNLTLDDGTSIIRGSLIGDTAESFIGEKTDKVALLNEEGELEPLLQKINRELMGTEYIFNGRARYSDYSDSYEITINKFQPIDPIYEADQLLTMIENNKES